MTSPNTPESGMPATPDTPTAPEGAATPGPAETPATGAYAQPPTPGQAAPAAAPEAVPQAAPPAYPPPPAPDPATGAYPPPVAPPDPAAPVPPAPPRRRTGLFAALVAIGLVILLGAAFGITYAVRSSGQGGSAAPVINAPVKPSFDPNAPLVVEELFPDEISLPTTSKTFTLEQIGVWEEDCDDLGTDDFGRDLEEGCEYRIEFAYRTDDREYLVAGHLIVYADEDRAEEVADSMQEEEYAFESIKTRAQAEQTGWRQLRYESLKRYVFVATSGSMDGFRTKEAITDDENVIPLLDGLLTKVRGKIFWGK